MSYNYTNGDGVAVLLVTEPDGATEPVSSLDDAIRQIKAYLNDPVKGPQAIFDSEVGKIEEWAFSTPPAGRLACDFGAVSRTTYAALFAKIGTVFGAGDGTTTFNVPDFRSRSPVGLGAGDADYASSVSIGAKSGAEGALMTAGMLVPHDHPIILDKETVQGGGASVVADAPGNGTFGTYPGFNTEMSTGGASPIPSVTPRIGVLVTIRY